MIKRLLREALLREANKRDEYGCVMVYFTYDKSDWKKLQDVIEEEDLYDPKDETGFGREKNPHATVLFGLHTDIPDSDIMDKIKTLKKPKIKIDKVSSFENPEFEVLKYDLTSDDLQEANKVFTKFPHTTDFPNYHPHTTIAYVKKGKAKKYIKKLNEITPLKFVTEKFVYSKANGEKKYHIIK